MAKAKKNQKGLDEWMQDINDDEYLMEAFMNFEDPEDVVKLASKYGYKFTEKELLEGSLAVAAGGKNKFGSHTKVFLEGLIDKG